MTTNETSADHHFISLHQAVEMTGLYRENRETILAEKFKGQDILALSETFSKEAFNSFFTNPECKALRIYYGMSHDLKVHAIIVGVNAKDEDILPNEANNDLSDPVVIVEDGKRCPPTCPVPSPLNITQ